VAVDVANAIATLKQELERITKAIAALEALNTSQLQIAPMPGRSKRGRKSMGRSGATGGRRENEKVLGRAAGGS
jgi:hypothetical protein